MTTSCLWQCPHCLNSSPSTGTVISISFYFKFIFISIGSIHPGVSLRSTSSPPIAASIPDTFQLLEISYNTWRIALPSGIPLSTTPAPSIAARVPAAFLNIKTYLLASLMVNIPSTPCLCTTTCPSPAPWLSNTYLAVRKCYFNGQNYHTWSLISQHHPYSSHCCMFCWRFSYRQI